MTTNQLTGQQREEVIAAQESDQAWFENRPARTHRMRLPTPADLRDYGTKTTHMIVKRRGRTQFTRVPITLTASADPFFVGLLMKDTLKDGVKDLAITGLMHAFRAGRRIDFEEICLRDSRDYNVRDTTVLR
jgi:hypothetical protein